MTGLNARVVLLAVKYNVSFGLISTMEKVCLVVTATILALSFSVQLQGIAGLGKKYIKLHIN